MRAKPAVFVPETDVICLVSCNDSNVSETILKSSAKEYEFFVGTIVKALDGHVKVHFSGLAKKDDVWFEQDSPHLFLDGGRTDPPSSDDDESKTNPKSTNGMMHKQKKRRK